jgi:hypothetical protein
MTGYPNFLNEREARRIAFCTRRGDTTALRSHLLRRFGSGANIEEIELA